MKTAILFSGGLDSTCAAILNPDATLIRVGIGSRYDAIEGVQAQFVADALGRELVHVNGVVNLCRYEQADALIPARNAMLVLAAAQHVQHIQLVSVSGDGTHATDKDTEFASIMSLLVAKLFDGVGSVTVPYRDKSKLDLLLAAYDHNGAQFRNALPHVFSCYAPTDLGHHCGRCKACVRLWGALAWAGVHEDGPTFAVTPAAALTLEELAQVYEGRGSEGEVAMRVYRAHKSAA